METFIFKESHCFYLLLKTGKGKQKSLQDSLDVSTDTCAATTGNLLEMEFLMPHSGLPALETLKVKSKKKQKGRAHAGGLEATF